MAIEPDTASLRPDKVGSDDSALYWASRNGHLDIVEYLINNGAENEFVLCTASERGHLDIVKYLISHNADIHVNNDRAFRYALLYNQLEVVKYLVANGANVNADKDFTLIWASMNSHLDVVEYLKRIMNRM
jgi:ankyrin repeat protein